MRGRDLATGLLAAAAIDSGHLDDAVQVKVELHGDARRQARRLRAQVIEEELAQQRIASSQG